VAKKSPQTEGAKAPPPSDIAVPLLTSASIIAELLSTAAAALPAMGGFKGPTSRGAVARTCVRRRSLQYRLSTTFLSQKWHLRHVCPSFKKFLVTTLQVPTSISVVMCVDLSGNVWTLLEKL
jgi:hypothetical protein